MRKKQNILDDKDFKYDYNNITDTHNKICIHFKELKKELPSLYRIRDYLNTILEDKLQEVTRKTLLIHLNKVAKLIESLEHEENYNLYFNSVKNIISRYIPLSKKPVIQAFCDKKKIENPAQKYIDIYNNVARRYYVLPIIEKKSGEFCRNCGSSSIKHYESKTICTKCCCIMWKRLNNTIYEDKEKIIPVSKYGYDPASFFKISVKRYQGKHNPKIPVHIYNKIYSLIDSYKMNIGEMSKMDTYILLKDHNLSNYIEDINFLHYDLKRLRDVNNCNDGPPDITQYESRLYAEYSMYDSIYEDILKLAKTRHPNINRENSTNSFYTLCKLLERQGYQMSREDRNIFLKCDDKIAEHDRIWECACEILGWNFIETI